MKSYKSSDKEYLSKYGEISSGYFEDRKSKFFCYIFNINSNVEAEEYIDTIRKDNKDARHVIYLYSYIDGNNSSIKFSDDGEPQGTGTRAIYDMIVRDNITNVCIIIVRYFGGTLLGAGPLARAYLNSFRDATKNLVIDDVKIYDDFEFIIKYSDLDEFKSIISKYERSKDIIIENITYDSDVTIKLKIDKNVSLPQIVEVKSHKLLK